MLSSAQNIVMTMIWLTSAGVMLLLPMSNTIAIYSYDPHQSINRDIKTDTQVSHRTTSFGVYSRRNVDEIKLIQPLYPQGHPISNTENAYGVTIDWQVN